MTSIDDFVGHRWTDAKVELTKLDRNFVESLDSVVKLQRIGLESPYVSAVDSKPKQRISKAWHSLLEACMELTMQADILQVAAHNLTADAWRNIPHGTIGKQVAYHIRSWFVHAVTLAERTNRAIYWTTKVYIDDEKSGYALYGRLQKLVRQQVIEPINEQRHQYVHGDRRSWASGMTEDDLWEDTVAIGMIPQRLLEEFYYPTQEESLRHSKYDSYINHTVEVLNLLGSILQDLETNILVEKAKET